MSERTIVRPFGRAENDSKGTLLYLKTRWWLSTRTGVDTDEGRFRVGGGPGTGRWWWGKGEDWNEREDVEVKGEDRTW